MWLLLQFWMLTFVMSSAELSYTNIKCESVDRNFSNMEYCFLKSINRTYKYSSVKIKLLQQPINDLTLNIGLYKKASGYKPFLYNFTLNWCQYMRKPNNPVLFVLMATGKKYGNYIHPCPIDHDLTLEKLPASELKNLIKHLPFPCGDYAVFTKWYNNNILRFTLDLYGTLD